MRWLIGVLILTIGPSSPSAQSLAEAAKNAAAAREKNRSTPSKVYTDKDLTTSPRDQIAAETRATKAAAGIETTETATTAATPTAGINELSVIVRTAPANTLPTTEGEWRAKRADLQAQLDRDRLTAAALQDRLAALNVSLGTVQYRVEQTLLERQKEDALTELGRLQATVVADEHAIATFEEQARRAGVPPGWLRP